MAFIGDFVNEATGQEIQGAYQRISLIEYMPKAYCMVRVSVYVTKEARLGGKLAIKASNYRIDGEALATIEEQGKILLSGIYEYLSTLPDFSGLEEA